VHKLLDIVWHNAVESLVEHRAWLAEDRRGQDGGKNQLAQIWNKITSLSPYVFAAF